ncbi:GNAT family N-acetyltransferase [Rhizobium sp. AG855]|uniref:GNAT family N-acetyltransferase n=1 Tax=Rhizobium sp. AG855 TaxID=2183898 RepID=UPI000E747AE0|nr:GNAT family N-acetyltransferase [Rhizobium sp. AG855]RKE79273.1 acetyltransferase (GNAT) family protein [Rhizobium sp. AG855]
MTSVHIRDLNGIAEFRQAEALQAEVWGHGDTPDAADLMMVIQAEGGLVAGAFVDGRLAGYVFGFPTRDPNIQHSHRLAVAPGLRGKGLGAELKWYQRDWCLQRGIRHVRWTFDPLRITNARLNLNRLGGRSSTYLVNYYGDMGGINTGLPSDRLLLDWYLDDPKVARRAEGELLDDHSAHRLLVPIDDGSGTHIAKAEGADDLSSLLDLRSRLQDALSQGFHIVGVDSGRYVLDK